MPLEIARGRSIDDMIAAWEALDGFGWDHINAHSAATEPEAVMQNMAVLLCIADTALAICRLCILWKLVPIHRYFRAPGPLESASIVVASLKEHRADPRLWADKERELASMRQMEQELGHG